MKGGYSIISEKSGRVIVLKKNIKPDKTQTRNSFQFSKHVVSAYQVQGAVLGDGFERTAIL